VGRDAAVRSPPNRSRDEHEVSAADPQGVRSDWLRHRTGLHDLLAHTRSSRRPTRSAERVSGGVGSWHAPHRTRGSRAARAHTGRVAEKTAEAGPAAAPEGTFPLDRREALYEAADCDPALYARQPHARAGVDAAAECQVPVGLAADVEAVR